MQDWSHDSRLHRTSSLNEIKVQSRKRGVGDKACYKGGEMEV
jgi:hypothetical protein